MSHRDEAMKLTARIRTSADMSTDTMTSLIVDLMRDAERGGYNEGHADAKNDAEDRIIELEALTSEVYVACVAADEGVPAAGKWAADEIERAGVGLPVARMTAQMLARQRPRDYYVHG